MKRVAIVAGETSGDYLGSEIAKALKARFPDVELVGLAGPLMQSQGVRSLAEMDKISIMGFDGLLGSIAEILAIRSKLYKFFVDWQPDVFIGIDVPDFNLGLEIKLKRHGIPIAHCVSPTVWAWRGGRIKKIKRAVDLMLPLFPFEAQYYARHDTPAQFIGHPLAAQALDWSIDQEFSEEHLSEYNAGERVIALLPGSRMSEVSRLAPTMFEAARVLADQFHDVRFIVPAAKSSLYEFMVSLPEYDPTIIKLVQGYSRDVLAHCYLTVLASGTAALEAALFAKPMVVLYKVSKLTAWYAGRTMQVDHYSMPNHLTSPPAVKEFVQEAMTAKNIVDEVSRLLSDQSYYQQMQSALGAIAPTLNLNSGELVAEAAIRLAGNPDAFRA